MRDLIGSLITPGTVLVIVVTIAYAGFCIGVAIVRTQAIDHGAAYHHPETGRFTWKERE